MIKADLHIHSLMSPDSNESIDAICLKAIELGLETIAITDHYEFFYPNRRHPVFNPEHVEEAFKIIEEARIRYSGALNILFGIEAGQPHLDFHNAMRLVSSFDFDFVLASFHKVGGSDLMNHDYLSKEERERTLYDYLDGLLVIASSFDFDSLSHLDLIKRYSFKAGCPLSIESEEERVRAILKVVASRKKALEVNTSTMKLFSAPMPSDVVLRWFKEEGGEYVTLASDAHKSGNIALGFSDAYDIIKRCGFDGYTVFKNRKPEIIYAD